MCSVKRQGKSENLIIGGDPRIDLLPPEVRSERRAKNVRRRLGLCVIGVVAIVVAGSGAATALAVQAQTELLAEQGRTAVLVAEQGKYVSVRKVQEHVALVEAAQQVGASTEIDWKGYLDKVQATLPASVFIQTVNIDAATPLAVYPQPTAPLQGARIATIAFSATSAALPEVPAWLTSLATLPGYADALPGSVTRDETTKEYTVEITMHINEAAFSQRFAPEGK
jgi:hypothetical protein